MLTSYGITKTRAQEINLNKENKNNPPQKMKINPEGIMSKEEEGGREEGKEGEGERKYAPEMGNWKKRIKLNSFFKKF